MNRRILALVVLLSLHALPGCSRNTGNKEFSLDPPAGWSKQEVPGLKYPVWAGPAADGFAPNINVVDEAFSGSLEEYTEGNLRTVARVFEGFRLLGKEPFETNSGLKGMRATVENVQQGRRLRQTFYFFGDGSKYYVVTCSQLASGENLDEVF